MLGSIIKRIRCLCYKYPHINEDILGSGKFSNLKVALLTDYLTTVNLSYECRIKCLTTKNFSEVLLDWKPDFIFIESAFHGYNWSWSYKLAKHSKAFGFNYLKSFKQLISLANDLNIPTVFWNKDDGAFFKHFIDAASLCDYIYTADINSVELYKKYLEDSNSSFYENIQNSKNTQNSHITQNCNYSNLETNLNIQNQTTDKSDKFNSLKVNANANANANVNVNVNVNESDLFKDRIIYDVNDHKIGLMKMAIQPQIHNFKGFSFHKNALCFAGSYYRKILDNRRIFLNDIFDVGKEANFQIDIFDRNSNRISKNFDFKFPNYPNVNILKKLSNEETAEVYRKYNVSLNVNSITQSETMCSRRLLEIFACGGIVATNNSKAVETLFSDYCTVIHNKDEALELLPQMVSAVSSEHKERAIAASEYITKHFTWEKRLEQLAEDINL